MNDKTLIESLEQWTNDFRQLNRQKDELKKAYEVTPTEMFQLREDLLIARLACEREIKHRARIARAIEALIS